MWTNTRQQFGVLSLPRTAVVAAGLIGVLALPALLSAQDVGRTADAAPSGVDARWQPWLGCWQLLRDSVHEPGLERRADPPRGGVGLGREASADGRVCVAPAEEGTGVRVRTEVQGAVVFEEAVVADDTRHPIEGDGACGGWRSAEWSADGRRLFGRAELTCAGDAPQAVSHLWVLDRTSWFDVQGITRDGRQVVRVRRYRRVGAAPGEAAESRAPSLGRPFDVEAVKEASRKVDSLVLQAALAETQSRFALNGRTMLALQQAGVPGDVTDLMVALTYPRRYRVSRADAGGGGGGFDDWGQYGWLYPLYAPFAYSDWGFTGGWGAPVVIVDGGGGGGAPREGRGRVVNNRGYTRIEEAVEPARARAGAASSSDTSASDSGSSGSSGSSGGVSSQGYSGGGSDSGGRTAVPR